MDLTHLYRLETLIAVVVAATLSAVATTVVVQAPAGTAEELASCQETLGECPGALAECRQRPAYENQAEEDDLERWKRQTRERGQSRPVGIEDLLRGGGVGPDG